MGNYYHISICSLAYSTKSTSDISSGHQIHIIEGLLFISFTSVLTLTMCFIPVGQSEKKQDYHPLNHMDRNS